MKQKRIILTLFCIGFIFLQSLIPESKSANESLWFTEHILNPILNWFGVAADKDVVRKIAHAVEFCILTFVVALWWKKPIRAFYAGFTLAFLDESLQVVTGRGALITDIWIDLIGVGIGVLIEKAVQENNSMKSSKTAIK